ncbi:MAG TPA: polysaccharide pyruvyl transferase family protein [Roseomonas sp.]|nr:polysaccharide pyruvyl transferase family protein [Roseomonas sp.]
MTLSRQIIPYRYYNTIRNCGDAITAHILRKVFDVDGVVADGSKPHLLAVGSIFFMATESSHIWGSGVINPTVGIPPVDPNKIHAVRGTRTRDYLHERGFKLADVPMGDAGILANQLVRDFSPPRRFKAAIVPHHASLKTEKFDRFRRDDDFCFVDMLDDSLTPLELIAASDVVISQSLHGIIFAEALGKPNLWVSDINNPVWNFKFEDWYSTTWDPQKQPAPLTLAPDEMIRRADLRGIKVKAAALKAAFPRELIRDAEVSIEDFDVLRSLSPLAIYTDDAISNLDSEGNLRAHDVIQKLTKMRRSIFRNASEPTYLAVLWTNAYRLPSRADLLASQRFLDNHREYDFIWLPGSPAPDLPPGFSAAQGNFGETALTAGSIMLRPSAQISGKSMFAFYRPE